MMSCIINVYFMHCKCTQLCLNELDFHSKGLQNNKHDEAHAGGERDNDLLQVKKMFVCFFLSQFLG